MAAAALLSSCSKTPKGVIPEKDMAVLLADMAEGDAVVELNRSDYGNDESRKALKQSILIKNGYTQADFDKSLMWYGHNLDVYGDVYDDVVSILEDRQRDARNEAKKVGERLVAAGDSVDVWQQSHSLLFDRRQCGGLVQLAFSYPADSEMRTGDRYEWRMQMVNAKNAATLFVGVDYADGSSEFQSQSLMPEETASIVLHAHHKACIRIYELQNGDGERCLCRQNLAFALALASGHLQRPSISARAAQLTRCVSLRHIRSMKVRSVGCTFLT